jgi:hypothetical protein
MVTIERTGARPVTIEQILDREHTIARAGFKRWLVIRRLPS